MLNASLFDEMPSIAHVEPGNAADPHSKRGDIWLLGNHRIMCGDSTNSHDVSLLLAGERPDLVCTDPLYGITVLDAHGKVGGGKASKKNTYAPVAGNDSTDTARKFYDLCVSMGMVNFVVWGGNYFTDFLPPKKCWIVWDKKGRKWDDRYSDFEMAWTSFDRPAKIFTHLWMRMIQQSPREKRVHPMQKPVHLMMDCIEYVMPEAKVIYDGFSGSGSTLLACEKSDRQARVMELSVAYVDVAIKRWQELTGRRAEHAVSGDLFPVG